MKRVKNTLPAIHKDVHGNKQQRRTGMPADIGFLQFADGTGQVEDANDVYSEYLRYVAGGKMRRYKGYIHDRGAKQGQSYYGHVIDLTSIAEKLRPPITLDATEMRCILLALTIHDMNKLPPYDKRADGKEAKYADAATEEN